MVVRVLETVFSSLFRPNKTQKQVCRYCFTRVGGAILVLRTILAGVLDIPKVAYKDQIEHILYTMFETCILKDIDGKIYAYPTSKLDDCTLKGPFSGRHHIICSIRSHFKNRLKNMF